MDISDAIEQWERGDRKSVNRAVKRDIGLLHKLKMHLTESDYWLLSAVTHPEVK